MWQSHSLLACFTLYVLNRQSVHSPNSHATPSTSLPWVSCRNHHFQCIYHPTPTCWFIMHHTFTSYSATNVAIISTFGVDDGGWSLPDSPDTTAILSIYGHTYSASILYSQDSTVPANPANPSRSASVSTLCCLIFPRSCCWFRQVCLPNHHGLL